MVWLCFLPQMPPFAHLPIFSLVPARARESFFSKYAALARMFLGAQHMLSKMQMLEELLTRVAGF